MKHIEFLKKCQNHWTLIRILLSSSKSSKKNLDSYCFVTSFGLFFSLKNDVTEPAKRKKQKNFIQKLFFCWPLEDQ
jgi:hypothetical protein